MGLNNNKGVLRHSKMQFYWITFIILQLLLLVTQTKVVHASDVIRIGGLFKSDYPHLAIAFRQAVDTVNKDQSVMPDYQLAAKIATIESNDSFGAARKACSITKSGVGAIFGPQSPKASDQVEAICQALDIPHIKTTMDLRDTGDEYAINLYPHSSTLGEAYSEVLKSLGWQKFRIIYENNNGLICVQDLIKDGHFDVTLKQLPSSGDYRSVFNEAREDDVRNVVLDVSQQNLLTVLKQAQQVGMMTAYHNYFITSLDLHTIGLEEISQGGVKIFSLQLVDPQNTMVQQVLRDLGSETNSYIRGLQTDVALMYDAVKVFAGAVEELGRARNIEITSLDCDAGTSWDNGAALNNYMRMAQLDGLSGFITFDADGFRNDIELSVVKLTKGGLQRIGSWNQASEGNSTTINEDYDEDALEDKTLTVSVALSAPYVMYSESSEPLYGNDRYEGFCIDLLYALSRELGFNFTININADNAYGYQDTQTKQWKGLIGDIMNLRADLAVTDLTITAEREAAVDFTRPYMNTGISILYKKPRRVAPSSYIFMAPFSMEVWLYLALTYLGVSLILFALARLSPCEQVSERSTLEDNHGKTGNSFSWDNALWFTVGSILQQRTYQQPRAASTRIVAFMWWFFVLIMVCCYIAGLVYQLGAEVDRHSLEPKSAEDLVRQPKIKYGTVRSGSTMAFFRDSNIETYKTLFNQFEYVNSNEEGQQRVQQSEGGYAFFMEAATIDVIVESECDLMQLGGLLNSISYGIALPKGSPYLQQFNTALLQLKEDRTLDQLERKWKYERGGWCRTGPSPPPSRELKVLHVAGVFVILLVGVGVAVVVAITEFLWVFIKNKNKD